MQKKRIGFLAACLQFFGLLPGQGNIQFAQECRKLSHADRLELASLLRAEGIDCDDPAPVAEAA